MCNRAVQNFDSVLISLFSFRLFKIFADINSYYVYIQTFFRQFTDFVNVGRKHGDGLKINLSHQSKLFMGGGAFSLDRIWTHGQNKVI